MRLIAKLCAVMLGVLLLTSCVPESKNPLSDPQGAKCDSRLIGTWACVDNGKGRDVSFVHFIERVDTAMDVLWVSWQPRGWANIVVYRMHPTRIGRSDYMNLKPSGGMERLKDTVPEWGTNTTPEEFAKAGYLLVKYELSSGGVLTVWPLDNHAVSEAIQAGKLKGEVGDDHSGRHATITDTPENLARFLETTDHQVLFEQPLMRLRKVDPALPPPTAPAK